MRSIAGVREVVVDFEKGSAIVEMIPGASLTAQVLAEAVSGIGFTATVAEVEPVKTVEVIALPLDFSLPLLDGKLLDGSKLKGKVVLLDFWATWCAPCLEAFPTMKKLQKDFGKQGLQVVSIALNSGTVEDVSKVVAKYEVDYPVVMGDTRIEQKFKVLGYPTYVLVNPDGEVADIYVGEDKDLYAKVAAAVKANQPDKSETAQQTPSDVERIVEALVEDWGTRFHASDISTVMKNLEIKQNDELRMAVGKHLRANPALAQQLRQWGANNFILNNDEKRIAKYVTGVYSQSNTMPKLEAVAEAVTMTAEGVKGRLEFMMMAGLLTQSDTSELGYALVEDYALWGGPLRYNFHSVVVEGVKPFGVW